MENSFVRFGWVAFGLCVIAGLVWSAIGGEPLFGPPGKSQDDVYFENIAWQLTHGRGISFDFTDKEWQQPYLTENLDSQFDWFLNLKLTGATTSRAPGLPILIATVYSIVGRDFFLVRLTIVCLMAVACSWLVRRVAQHYGWLAAAIGLTTLLLDGFVWRTAGQFMSEGPAVAITAVLCGGCWLLSREPMQSSWRTKLGWFAVGILFGIGALFRSLMNGWFVLLAIGLVTLLARQRLSGRPWKTLAGAALWFGMGAVAVGLPWWTRNCLVTGGFAPFGTAGSFGLVGGYCDAALADFGNWNLEATVESQQRTLERPGISGLPLARQEYLMGQDSTAAAKAWAEANWSKLPQLVGMKMLSHLGFYHQPPLLQLVNGLILFGAVLGCWSTRHSLGRWIALIVLLSLVTTGLTWSHYGRYSIPFRPLLHIACGLGTVYLWSSIFRWLRSPNISRSGG